MNERLERFLRTPCGAAYLCADTSRSAYLNYLKAAGGLQWAPVLLSILALAQGAMVASNIVLGFWTDGTIHGYSNAQYMGLYA